MKILHVITGIRKAAGTSVFCCEMCTELVGAGHAVSLAVCNLSTDDVYATDARVRLLSIGQLLSSDGRYDVIHIHGLWSPILHKVAVWSQKKGIPVVWSPHGMLTEWAFHFKWWKKLPAWYLYQKKDLANAALIHVTAESEVEDVRRAGLTNKVIIAPLGVRLPPDEFVKSSISLRGVLLFVSRIQRKKGLANLIKAWAEMMRFLYAGRVTRIKCLDHLIQATNVLPSEDWRLRIVGPDQEGHTAELKSLAQQLGVSDRIHFVGPKYGDELTKEYAAADCFILPSYSENFGSVVLEALAVGTPVIASKGTPWKILEDEECGFWVENDPDSLSSVLLKMMKLTDDERAQMGARGRRLVEECYTWAAVCDKMVRGYEGVLK